jgi:hypothetical protein
MGPPVVKTFREQGIEPFSVGAITGYNFILRRRGHPEAGRGSMHGVWHVRAGVPSWELWRENATSYTEPERGRRGSMRPFFSLASALLLLGMLACPLEAGVLIVYEQDSFSRPGKAKMMVYLDRDRMRMETKGSDQDHVILFRGDRKLYWMIDKSEGTYMEISRNDLQKMKSKMGEARRAFEEQMKNVPPEQRRMAEAMMKNRMPKQPPKTTYRKKASGVKVNRWICDQYEGYREREKTEEIWAADVNQFDFRPEEFQVLDDVREFAEEFSKQSLPFYRIEAEKGRKGDDYSGVPVKMISFAGGKKDQKMELKEIQRRDVAPSLFELPGGLQRKEIPW